ncbi:MAG TPA: nucleotidyltransferase domain-containing protein [Candidatus Thermoplasmatota archaeon]
MAGKGTHQRRLRIASGLASRLKAELGPSVRRVVLYGSVARGDDRAGSDIDLLVEVRRRTQAVEDRVSDAVTDVAIDEGELVVPIVLSSAEMRKRLPASFMARIRAEGKVLVRSG